MNEDNLKKSKIAFEIVYRMLQDSGFMVVPFRNDEMLDHLAGVGIKKDNIAGLLFSIPNLIVIGKKKEAILLSIKYSGRKKSGRNIDWGSGQIKKYWPGTLMIVVMNYDPFFLVLEKNKLVALEKSIFKVNKKISEKFAHQIIKYFPV